MHGPSRWASKRRRSANPEPVVREASRRTGTPVAGHGVGLAAELQRVDGHLEVHVGALARGQAQRAEVERVGQGGHPTPG